MNPPTNRATAFHAESGSRAAEETLRLIANLPVPQGVEDRVKAGLRGSHRTGRVLPWPTFDSARSWVQGPVTRSVAAAAIVLVVAGGGWGVYTLKQPTKAPKAVDLPRRLGAPGGFSSAGAMRTPQTFTQPLLVQPDGRSPESATAKATERKSHHKAKSSATKKLQKP